MNVNITSKNELNALASKLKTQVKQLKSEIESLKASLSTVQDFDGIPMSAAANTLSGNLTIVGEELDIVSSNIQNYATSVEEFDKYTSPTEQNGKEPTVEFEGPRYTGGGGGGNPVPATPTTVNNGGNSQSNQTNNNNNDNNSNNNQNMNYYVEEDDKDAETVKPIEKTEENNTNFKPEKQPINDNNIEIEKPEEIEKEDVQDNIQTFVPENNEPEKVEKSGNIGGYVLGGIAVAGAATVGAMAMKKQKEKEETDDDDEFNSSKNFGV